MNIDHRLYVALSSDSAPEGVSKAEMVNYLADAADASWSYALTWYDDWLAKQEAVDAQDEAYGCMADWDKEEALDRIQRLGQEFDAINPPHYRQGNVECINAICDALGDEQFKGYLRGNVLKYLWRLEHKGCPLENGKKGRWYLDRLIAELELEKGCE